MKRALCLALILSLLLPLPGALAQTWSVGWYSAADGYLQHMLIRDDGTPVTDPEEYSALEHLTDDHGGRFACARFDPSGTDEHDDPFAPEMALMDGDGRVLTPFAFNWILYEPGCGLFRFYRPLNAGIGLMNQDGVILAEGKWSQIAAAGDGGFLALSDDDNALLRVEPDGTVRETGLHAESISPADRPEDPILASGVAEFDGDCAFLDADGSMLFGQTWPSAEAFSGGLALVMAGESRWGAIDTRGSLRLPARYSAIHADNLTGAGVLLADGPEPFTLTILDAGTLAVRARMDYSAIPGLSDLTADCPGGSLVQARLFDGEYNLLHAFAYDLRGRPIDIDLSHDAWMGGYYDEHEGTPQRTILQADGRATLLAPDGTTHGDFQQISDSLWRDGHGRYTFQTFSLRPAESGEDPLPNWNTLRHGVCDENGEVLLPARYTQLTILSLDRFWVQDSQRTGLVDAHGNWLYAMENYAELLD